MLVELLALTAFQIAPIIPRDSYGVPHVSGSSTRAAFRMAGYAVAQDRLWQMENSRRIARGTMAEAFGERYVASDRELILGGYTDSELEQQIDRLAPEVKEAFEGYAEGVNGYIDWAKAGGHLPEGYKTNGFEPEPWSVLDSAAITVRLFRLFGQGGAGEIRNLALLKYLQARPNKDQALQIFDDFLWQNDSRAQTTIAPIDDRLSKIRPAWPALNRSITENHLRLIPNVNLGELLPAIKMASREEETRVAMVHSAPYKAGSYAIVVSGAKAADGVPKLLSAPQMGHQIPAIIHEMSIESPGYSAVGMDVPGVPGIAIGHTKSMAWGLTSGVADTIDIFFSKLNEAGDAYLYDGAPHSFQTHTHTIKVKGSTSREVTVKRTRFGPVIATSPTTGTVFSQRATHWRRELESMNTLFLINQAKNAKEINRAVRTATVSFNFFYAFRDGNIGYRYLGRIPKRADGVDPRFPTPGESKYDWKGFIDPALMPYVDNPKSGLITNWNNKPVSWWNNADTPVWGRTFRIESLRNLLPNRKLKKSDLVAAIRGIAEHESNWIQLAPVVKSALASHPDPRANLLSTWRGKRSESEMNAALYEEFFNSLKDELFLGTTGNFLSPATFRLVTQTHIVLDALEGKSKVDYLKGRTKEQVIRAAIDRALSKVAADATYKPGTIAVPSGGGEPIPYSDRGSYIQVIEFLKSGVKGENVVNPGVAETGPHSFDQTPFARTWTFKPMSFQTRKP